MKRIILFLLITIFLQSYVNGQKQQLSICGPQNGSLLIIGGNTSSPEIYAKFLELAGGPEAKLVIIPTAIADEYLLVDGAIEKIIKTFTSIGFKNIKVLHTRNPEEANTEEFVKPLRTANAVYFMGGRQWRIADGFLNTMAHKELFKVLDRGGVIGGSSAGASIQGSYLVRGDTKTNVVMMGDHEEGLGFLKKEDWLIERLEIIQLPEGSERFYLLGEGRVYDLKNRRVIK